MKQISTHTFIHLQSSQRQPTLTQAQPSVGASEHGEELRLDAAVGVDAGAPLQRLAGLLEGDAQALGAHRRGAGLAGLLAG